MTDIGINCRASAGYATDGPNETYWLGEAYPVTRGGVTFGGEASAFLAVDGGLADRRLAGCCYLGSSAPTNSALRVDLPATGAYDVHAAIGWYNGSFTNYGLWDMVDGSTVFQSIDPAGTTGLLTDFFDATSTLHAGAAWAGSEAAFSHTFTSTIFRLRIRADPPSNSNVVAHVRIVSAGGTPSAFGHRFYRQFILSRGAA